MTSGLFVVLLLLLLLLQLLFRGGGGGGVTPSQPVRLAYIWTIKSIHISRQYKLYQLFSGAASV